MEARDSGREDAGVSAGVRKTVTIVFADLAGSTELGERLDPEALRDVQTRYFAAMREPLERHGGTVEKFIGDAVVAVFGVPVLHEDDALRAVRAAADMREALAGLNAELERDLGIGLQLRIGVNTGEVAGGASSLDHAFVAGDAVNTAARLQAAAPPGGIVLGPQTRSLVEGVARLRPHGIVELRGKRRPTRVWTVDRVAAAAPWDRPSAVPLVGRGRELARLQARLRRAVRRGRCVLVPVVGPAGIGKSRLVREFLARVGDDATVAVGRCLPYGEGITYRPLAELVGGLAGGGSPERIRALLAGDEQAGIVAGRLAALTGGADGPGGAQDVQWAARRLVEAVARRRPLIAVVDDAHWAEPALLDLLEHLADFVAAPVLIVCLTRAELLDRRPRLAAVAGGPIRLAPLSEADSARLVGRLAARRRARVHRADVLAAAEGNPLFLEHLVAMRADDPGGRAPATIQALLAARVDALPRRERRAVEAAAVEGRAFHRGAVRVLAGLNGELDGALEGLVRRELVLPAPAELPGETGYRFAHSLVRDAAYELLPKRRRADLHVAFADWLRTTAASDGELAEFVGYHLEQAYRYRAELGRVDDARHRALAGDAARYLSVAGDRALGAGDRAGASNLLSRAAALRPADDPGRAALLIDLGGVLREEGRFADADAALGEALRLANGLANRPLEARAEVERLLARLQVDPDAVARRAARRGRALEAELEAAGDHAGLARLWYVRGLLAWIRARSRDAAAAWRRAADEAQAAGDAHTLADAVGWEAASVAVGPTPVEDGIPRCGEICRLLARDPWAEALARQPLASLHAMRGEFAHAFALLDASHAVLAGFGPTVDAAVSHPEVYVSMLAGEPERAERHLRAGRRLLVRMGERAVLASTEGYLAQVLLAGGREAEADRRARRCAALATADDAWPQAQWRQVRAIVLARGGRLGRALRLAGEAVEIAMTTDNLNLQAEALGDLATVQELAGAARDAAASRAASLRAYEAKGNLVRAREARARPPRPVEV